jgi:hypothetical protein
LSTIQFWKTFHQLCNSIGDDEGFPFHLCIHSFGHSVLSFRCRAVVVKLHLIAFDVAQALEAHRVILFLDHELIRHHTPADTCYWFSGSFTAKASAAVMPITLQPAVAMDQFANVSTL